MSKGLGTEHLKEVGEEGASPGGGYNTPLPMLDYEMKLPL